jgi:hypothetical protein
MFWPLSGARDDVILSRVALRDVRSNPRFTIVTIWEIL